MGRPVDVKEFNPATAEIIAIGSELLLGQIVDTNSSYIADVLAQHGIEVTRTSAVGDDVGRMTDILSDAISRSPIVITTGGLGPTEDDLTREVIAEATGHPLILHPDLLQQIGAWFERRGFQMTGNNRKQAYIPEGAIPLENPVGTAPAFIVEGTGFAAISLPGVPREMKYLMEHRVIPYLRARFTLRHEVIRYRVLRTCGLGESGIGQQIADLMKESRNPRVGTLASPGDVRIRITSKADDPDRASSLIQTMEDEIRKRLGPLIYGVDDETLHGNLARDLSGRNLTLAVVETFTGGSVLHRLTRADDPSLFQGVVLPSDASQERFLGLDPVCFGELRNDSTRLTDSLAKKGRDTFGSDLALAQATRAIERLRPEEYRIETVYSLVTPTGAVHGEHVLGGEPLLIRERASVICLDMVRKYLLNH